MYPNLEFFPIFLATSLFYYFYHLIFVNLQTCIMITNLYLFNWLTCDCKCRWLHIICKITDWRYWPWHIKHADILYQLHIIPYFARAKKNVWPKVQTNRPNDIDNNDHQSGEMNIAERPNQHTYIKGDHWWQTSVIRRILHEEQHATLKKNLVVIFLNDKLSSLK